MDPEVAAIREKEQLKRLERQIEDTSKDSGLQVPPSRSMRERVGLVVDGGNAAAAVKTIAAAEFLHHIFLKAVYALSLIE
jgi:hypothetical protein